MTSHTGIFTSAVSVETSLVTTTDINGFESIITTKSVAAAILSWLPDGNYTYLTYTYLPFRTDSAESPAATSTDDNPQATPSASAAPSTSFALGGGAIAGIVVGALAGVALVAALCWLVFRYRRKALGRMSPAPQSQGTISHHSPEDLSGSGSHLYEQNQHEKVHRYELGEPDNIPQQTQQQYQKPELDASTSEVSRWQHCLASPDVTNLCGEIILITPYLPAPPSLREYHSTPDLELDHTSNTSTLKIDSFIEIPWDLSRFWRDSSQAAEFTPFPRLPAEIRCKIWNAAYTPRIFPSSSFDASRKWNGKCYDRLVAPLPATARVNQEARAETLRAYSKISTTPSWRIMGFINYEVDTVRFSCFHSACNASKFPPTLLQNLQRITIVPRCWTRGCHPQQADFQTIDNFLQHIVAKYLPSLRELDIEIQSEMDVGRQSWLSACRGERTVGCPIRPVFFQTADGHRLQFLPTLNHRGGWDAVKILIMEKHEAAPFGGDEDRSENGVFLEVMGRCIWHVFKPEFLLKDDVDVEQLIGSHRFSQAW